MTDNRNERLSALLDDELTHDEMIATLDQLEADQSLCKSWDHYALIGDAIRGEAIRATASGISAKVSAALEDEPSILAAPKPQTRKRDSIELGGRRDIRWLRPAVGAALAASVAVAAVYISPFTDHAPNLQGEQVASAPAPSSNIVAAPGLPEGNRWKNLNEPGVALKLDQYLREHSEFSSSGGMGGVLPYASFVSYDNTRR